jgi:predicted amidophosphoribosyltransferase
VKRRETERQSRLPLSQRAGNVRGAFRAIGPAPERVLLVDDVATSGSTTRECAASLSAAGARDVTVCCFARASRADVSMEPLEEMEPLEDT